MTQHSSDGMQRVSAGAWNEYAWVMLPLGRYAHQLQATKDKQKHPGPDRINAIIYGLWRCKMCYCTSNDIHLVYLAAFTRWWRQQQTGNCCELKIWTQRVLFAYKWCMPHLILDFLAGPRKAYSLHVHAIHSVLTPKLSVGDRQRPPRQKVTLANS